MLTADEIADYARVLGRLSDQSVRKHFEAYRDVAWDDPENAIDPRDPRWELPAWDELGASSWYRGLVPERRRAIGLHLMAGRMKVGWQFENILQRGLLTFVEALPNHAPEFRYAHHEIIEESQHSLMFQEFVDRSGIDVPVLPRAIRLGNRPVIGFAGWFPEMFFLHVLSGEEPIDYLQRRLLREHPTVHPLLRRLAEIHVLEEARHVCFARRYLEQYVPALGWVRKQALQWSAPFVFLGSAQLMLKPQPDLIEAHAIPKYVVRDAYSGNPQHRKAVIDSLAKVRRLCRELDILTPTTLPLWQRLGVA